MSGKPCATHNVPLTPVCDTAEITSEASAVSIRDSIGLAVVGLLAAISVAKVLSSVRATALAWSTADFGEEDDMLH